MAMGALECGANSAGSKTVPDMDEETRNAAWALWRFHCVYDEPCPADVIIGLGFYDTRVADRCAAMFHDGLAPRIVFTGASGNWTKRLFPAGEARAFCGVAHLEEETSNAQFDQLFENLADWNEQLKHIDFYALDDPQAQPPLVEFKEPQP